ncbi:ParB N-terminal domain-containing protein [Pyrococcus sp. ST04]|uniref:ParB N-terminal domain-containing protein n=1 Tax=Pyrococcus sp. ST04 TaxID=1183377 RepID=UPI00064F176D|nr:ParB N-terminal domain-containing protein [Pyrococcus sp. ST04]
MVKLITREEAFKRAERIKRENELLYNTPFEIIHTMVPLEALIPTQKELNRRKFEIVFEKVIHGYDAPLIILEYNEKLYILDGHHRAYVMKILGFKYAEALILKPLKDVEIKIAKSVEKQGLRKIEDMKVVNY